MPSADVALNELSNGRVATEEIQSTALNGISKLQYDTIEETIESFKNGRFIIVLDSPSRENEGDLIIAAENVTEAKMGFMVRHTSGLICAPLASSLTNELQLPQMVLESTEADGTAYTVSVDYDHSSMTTGISAHDRALTCRMLASPTSESANFRRPGHLFPLKARDGGVRERRGHTEATIDFCKLAGKRPAGVLCELIAEGDIAEGSPEMKGAEMMRSEGCLQFGKRWGIRVCTIEALVEFLEQGNSKIGVEV